MLLRLISLGTFFFILTIGVANAGGEKLVMELHKIKDGKVIDRVSIYASEIDPNIRSVKDSFYLKHNDGLVAAPESLLKRLNYQRREFSYDYFTKGVSQQKVTARCMMAGPATGDILHVRYLTYKNHKIAKSEMRPVLSEGDNCLFTDLIRPNSETSEKSAAKVMAAMQVIRDFVSQ